MDAINDELHFSQTKLIVPHFQEPICESTQNLVARVLFCKQCYHEDH